MTKITKSILVGLLIGITGVVVLKLNLNIWVSSAIIFLVVSIGSLLIDKKL